MLAADGAHRAHPLGGLRARPRPPELEGLRRLAYNLYWTWHPRAAGLFARITRHRRAATHSPIPVLAGMVDWASSSTTRTSWSRPTGDRRVRPLHGERRRPLVPPPARPSSKGPIAYFCAEYGSTRSLGIYSGGLGVLAGDHMKAASDMALPLVGVGLLYRNGYFRQTIDADGHQEHATRLRPCAPADHARARARGRPAHGQRRAARARPDSRRLDGPRSAGAGPAARHRQPDNDPADRPITNILYVRGREMRLHQELILGVGGVRALRALGHRAGRVAPQRGPLGVPARGARPRAGRRRRRPRDALESVSGNSVFTIHTPVSAGNERFDRARPARRRPDPRGTGGPNTGGVPIERCSRSARRRQRRRASST